MCLLLKNINTYFEDEDGGGDDGDSCMCVNRGFCKSLQIIKIGRLNYVTFNSFNLYR